MFGLVNRDSPQRGRRNQPQAKHSPRQNKDTIRSMFTAQRRITSKTLTSSSPKQRSPRYRRLWKRKKQPSSQTPWKQKHDADTSKPSACMRPTRHTRRTRGTSRRGNRPRSNSHHHTRTTTLQQTKHSRSSDRDRVPPRYPTRHSRNNEPVQSAE